MCTLVAVHCAVVAGVAAAAPASSPALSTNWAESVYTSTELLWTTWVSYSVSIKWSFVKDLKSYFSKKTRQITFKNFPTVFLRFLSQTHLVVVVLFTFSYLKIWQWKEQKNNSWKQCVLKAN